MAASDDEYYTVPVKDQRVFGAGIKRKRVPFVAASSPSSSDLTTSTSSLSGLSVAQRYLATVGLSRQIGRPSSAPPVIEAAAEAAETKCDVCKLPLGTDGTQIPVPHEASLAHQVCLEHSHGASHVDRTRKGYSYLQAYGWDADRREGLGASGQGRLYPIKATEKRDTVGLGVDLKALKAGKLPKKVEKLNAKLVRETEEAGRRRKEKLQKMFTANDDVIRYLGELG